MKKLSLVCVALFAAVYAFAQTQINMLYPPDRNNNVAVWSEVPGNNVTYEVHFETFFPSNNANVQKVVTAKNYLEIPPQYRSQGHRYKMLVKAMQGTHVVGESDFVMIPNGDYNTASVLCKGSCPGLGYDIEVLKNDHNNGGYIAITQSRDHFFYTSNLTHAESHWNYLYDAQIDDGDFHHITRLTGVQASDGLCGTNGLALTGTVYKVLIKSPFGSVISSSLLNNVTSYCPVTSSNINTLLTLINTYKNNSNQPDVYCNTQYEGCITSGGSSTGNDLGNGGGFLDQITAVSDCIFDLVLDDNSTPTDLDDCFGSLSPGASGSTGNGGGNGNGNGNTGGNGGPQLEIFQYNPNQGEIKTFGGNNWDENEINNAIADMQLIRIDDASYSRLRLDWTIMDDRDGSGANSGSLQAPPVTYVNAIDVSNVQDGVYIVAVKFKTGSYFSRIFLIENNGKSLQTVNQVASPQFTMYPNPATNEVNLDVRNFEGTAQLQITDITGKVIATQVVSPKKGAAFININTADFAKGMYFVTLQAEGYNNTQNLVIQ